MRLRVQNLTGAARLVDAPSFSGWERGLPPGGPSDPDAGALAADLIPEAWPMIELTGEVVLRVEVGGALLVLSGQVRSDKLDQGSGIVDLRPDHLVRIRSGVSPHCLIAAPGGWRGKRRFGRVEGEVPDVWQSASESSLRPMRIQLPGEEAGPIRVVVGPQGNSDTVNPLFASDWTVSARSNRHGILLDGPALASLPEQPSSPAIPGFIQINRNGKPMILGPDGPTVGGYPKVAGVISADRGRLARQAAGAKVRFIAVSPEEAREVWTDHLAALAHRIQELRVATEYL